MKEDDEIESRGSLGPIRSISRSIAILQAINRGGAMSVAQIAESARVPYPTAYRIIFALVHEGLIEREPQRKLYRPTALVQSLAYGYQDHSRLAHIVHPYLIEYTAKNHWPLMVATPLGVNMIIREATHSLAPMALSHYYPGFTFPMLDSAAGRAYLAYIDAEERNGILETLSNVDYPVDSLALEGFKSGALVREILEKGYSSRPPNRFSNPPGKTSSIASPIYSRGRVVAALSLVVIASAVKLKEAEARYASDIVKMAGDIGSKLDLGEPEQP